jgi:NAD(P)-dependent dehydrogenase (short-subunit alcohol dehydrogenase family)
VDAAPSDRLTTPFGFATTALEVVAGVDLSGKRALVTGGASGIGLETARALATAGAEVTLAVRDLEAGRRAAAELSSATRRRPLHVEHLELTDHASIARLAARFGGPLHILVNNAAVMACPEQHTPEGVELQFATNHLGHFALALALFPALAAARGARIVSVSSSAHQRSPVIFEDLHFAFRQYDPMLAYGQSKTANALFAVGATARWSGEGIFANSLMPGAVARTGLHRHVGGVLRSAPERVKTPEQGAATSVLLAASPLLAGVGGKYFFDCNEAALLTGRSSDRSGVAPYALDPGLADRLWEASLRLLR